MQDQKKQTGFSFEWINSQEVNSDLNSSYLSMRGWQLKAFHHLKDSNFNILNAPMGSGKSLLMCWLSIHKLKADPRLKCIIAVPQTIIAPGFVEEKLVLDNGDKFDWQVNYNLCDQKAFKSTVKAAIEWLEADPSSLLANRVLLCTHATLVMVYKKLKEKRKLDLFDDVLLWIDEAHHVKNVAIENFEGVISNGLGELVRYFVTNSDRNLQLGLTTATFFRGDRGSLLTDDMEGKFKRFDLPYDEYMESMTHLKSFSFDFLIVGHDYATGIETILKDREGKDIIYIPHPTSRYSTGDKLKESRSIIAKYHEISGGLRIYTTEGVTVFHEDNNRFVILDLVDENNRAEKKEFLSNSKLKEDSDALDAIIALGMFKEGANWVWANRVIIVGARSSLVDVIQMVGRLFRDAKGKNHVQVIQLLPFSLDQQDEEKFRDNLNNYLKAIFASLILENILNPVKIKVMGERPNGNDDKEAITKDIQNWLNVVMPDDAKQIALIEDVFKQLLNIRDTNKQAAMEVSVLREEYQKIIPRILEEYDIAEHKEEIAHQIWGTFARQTLRMQGISVENINFDILQKTNPLDFLLRYTSGICGINTFHELRLAIAISRGPWRPFDMAKEFVRTLGLKSETEWRLYIDDNMPHLPQLPHDIPRAPWTGEYEQFWISWGDFLGTNQIAPRLRKYRSYENASKWAQDLGIKTKEEWGKYAKGEIPGLPSLPLDIPASPAKTYQRDEYGNAWISWPHFLGSGRISNQEKSKMYRPYGEAQKFVQSLQLKTAKEWMKYIKGEFFNLPPLPVDIPKKPDESYEEWTDWPTFLGSPLNKFNSRRSFWEFEIARKFVHSLQLKCQKDYVNYCAGKFTHLPQKPNELPSNPSKKYKGCGWKGEKDWLGY